jgi:hypothetical protein
VTSVDHADVLPLHLSPGRVEAGEWIAETDDAVAASVSRGNRKARARLVALGSMTSMTTLAGSHAQADSRSGRLRRQLATYRSTQRSPPRLAAPGPPRTMGTAERGTASSQKYRRTVTGIPYTSCSTHSRLESWS